VEEERKSDAATGGVGVGTSLLALENWMLFFIFIYFAMWRWWCPSNVAWASPHIGPTFPLWTRLLFLFSFALWREIERERESE